MANELLSGNEKKQANKGIETVLKHSRYYLLYILKNRLDQLEKDNRNLYLQDILENKLRDFVKVCTENIFLDLWREAIKQDSNIISNAPKFVKNSNFKTEVDKRLRKVDLSHLLSVRKDYSLI